MLESSNIVLVYFNCRGMAHSLRMLLLEIEASFDQINISACGKIPECLASYNISLCKIPCIIDGPNVINQLFPAMKYLCKKFNRLDMLGTSLYTQTKLNEVMVRYTREKCTSLCILFRNVSLFNKCPEKMKEIKQKIESETEQNVTWIKACEKLYAQSGVYLLDKLSILDFIFYEACFYTENIFSDIGIKKRKPIYCAFKNFFEKSEFYRKNKAKIESYSVLMPQFNCEINEGLKKMWAGDKKLLCCSKNQEEK